jgi:hypothetical protein
MLRRIILIAAVSVMVSCHQRQESHHLTETTDPLVDTLVQILDRLRETAYSNQSEEFLGMLDSAEAVRLRRLADRNGFRSLRTYVEHLFAHWPDPDTLQFGDLTRAEPYARLTLTSDVESGRYREEAVRYTFVLFKKEAVGWRLAAISTLEKRRYDPYGTEVSYLETELPPRLRFPRLF